MDWPEFVQNQAEDFSARRVAAGAGRPRRWGDGQGRGPGEAGVGAQAGSLAYQ